MFARLSTYQGSPVPEGGELTANAEVVVREVQRLAGFRGVYYLIDRASGTAKSLTLWEDEGSMAASESHGARIREESAQREGQRIVSVERFEVGFSHLEP